MRVDGFCRLSGRVRTEAVHPSGACLRLRPTSGVHLSRVPKLLTWPSRCGAVLAIAVLFWASAALPCADFPRAPSSRWSIGHLAGSPVLLTPCGDPFLSLGVNGVNG